ncbi:MAG: phosphotransferase [Thermoleophilaceae bacterium]|nr:phosphotransferase [Thermoleophilaceae bacterium]
MGGEPELRRLVEEAVAVARGGVVAISSLSTERSRYATRSVAGTVTAELADGSFERIFVKTIDPGGGEDPDKLPRDREPRVYRRLLDHRQLPAAAFLAARTSAFSGVHYLALEHVDDWSLKYQELEHWYTAARRLAELHAHFAARVDDLRDCDFLLRLDQSYFAAWADRGVDAVERASTPLGRRLRQALRGHDEVAELLASQPPTLVHNDLAPKNVVAETSLRPARICFVDWELAGVGCGLLDLVHLMHGLPPDAEREMCSAYRDGLEGSDSPFADGAADHLLAACALQNTLYRLAHIGAWRVAGATVAGWVDEIERLSDGVRH